MSEWAKSLSGWRRVSHGVLVGVVGFVLTAGFAVHVLHKPGVYFCSTRVLFLTPPSRENPNSLAAATGGVTAMAGTVSRMVEPHPPSAQVVSPLVMLTDEGIRHGWSVTLPNDGGQFANNFDQQLLLVQAVGSDPNEVRGTVRHLVTQINADLLLLQQRAHIPRVNRIGTSQNPATLQVFHDTGSPARALIAVLALGLGATLTATMSLTRWQERRGRRALAAAV